MNEKKLWEKLRINNDKSCEEMEARPNSDEYWKELQEKWEEKLK